jgi:hypothetical protein
MAFVSMNVCEIFTGAKSTQVLGVASRQKPLTGVALCQL